MSEREQIQNDIASFLDSVGLNEVYGVLTGLDEAPNGRCKIRTITFCRARTLDGCVSIYGPKFIKVDTNRDSGVFTSADDAKAWIKAKFVDFDHDAADRIPQK
jgi:hypothetical protein